MLAVLAAVTEVIKANSGTENTTEYFAALVSWQNVVRDLISTKMFSTIAFLQVTTLEGMKPEELTESRVSAILSLLSMCIKSVPKNILRLKFSAVSKTLMDQLKTYVDSDHNTILKAVSYSMFSTITLLMKKLNIFVLLILANRLFESFIMCSRCRRMEWFFDLCHLRRDSSFYCTY